MLSHQVDTPSNCAESRPENTVDRWIGFYELFDVIVCDAFGVSGMLAVSEVVGMTGIVRSKEEMVRRRCVI
jgi:hypothetical protein